MNDIDYPSLVMLNVLNSCHRAAEVNSPVLLLGETGSGKDYTARYIHKHSKRSTGPFLVINCAVLPPSLIESELFGYERGAFTGAGARKKGLIEAANGGTLFLNEIGDTSLLLQTKLLTYIDTQEFIRVGGCITIRADVRLIFATNRDLALMVAEGRFRQDLFYRLNVISIVVPPVRDRKEDIPLLAQQLLIRVSKEIRRDTPTLRPALLQSLILYDWPGNVRELKNLFEGCLALSTNERDFNERVVEELRKRSESVVRTSTVPGGQDMPPIIVELLHKAAGKRVRNPSADQKERLYRECIVESGWKQVDIARELGVSEAAVSYWLRDVKANRKDLQIL